MRSIGKKTNYDYSSTLQKKTNTAAQGDDQATSSGAQRANNGSQNEQSVQLYSSSSPSTSSPSSNIGGGEGGNETKQMFGTPSSHSVQKIDTDGTISFSEEPLLNADGTQAPTTGSTSGTSSSSLPFLTTKTVVDPVTGISSTVPLTQEEITKQKQQQQQQQQQHNKANANFEQGATPSPSSSTATPTAQGAVTEPALTTTLCSFGACCQNGFIKGKGSVCERSTSECREDAVCDGQGASCPEPLAKADGLACTNGQGSCKDGYCVTRTCFGDCCDEKTMEIVVDGTACGFDKKGKCQSGLCAISAEHTPEFIVKEQEKEKAYHELLKKLMKTNEKYAIKKAIRWFNPKQQSSISNK
jgi:hypothetical protein